MATFTVRQVPDEVRENVRQAAAARGVSMEQELRDLIQRTYAGGGSAERPPSLRGRARDLLAARGASLTVDDFLEERRQDWSE